MDAKRLSPINVISLVLFSILFAALGLLIIVVFSPYRPMLSSIDDFLGRIIIILCLVSAIIITGKVKKLTRYREVIIGLFILAATVSAVWIFANFLLCTIKLNSNNPSGVALLKLGECFVIFLVVVIFTILSGSNLSSIYIKKGNLKKGLIIGLVAFAITATGSIFISPVLFGANNLNIQRILTWLPWILIFAFANSAGEELLFRGLFLRKLEPLFGKLFSNIVIAFVFTALHLGVTYPKDQLLFLSLLIPLAFVWGHITQKTDSLLASVFFHAGMDVAIILGIFSNLTIT